jgi:hypothetical protein
MGMFTGNSRSVHGASRHGPTDARANRDRSWPGLCDDDRAWVDNNGVHPDDALADLETVRYFSMVTFTCVGYGDVVLRGPWRTLFSIEAANGVIFFGSTTALVLHFIQTIYRRK